MRQIVLTLILTVIGSIALFPKSKVELEVYDYRSEVVTYEVYINGPYYKRGINIFYEELTLMEIINYLGLPFEAVNLEEVNFEQKIYNKMFINIPYKDESKREAIVNGILFINRANFEDLIMSELFNKNVCEAIITYRQNNGFFKTVDELINVNGIGEVTLEKVRPFIEVL